MIWPEGDRRDEAYLLGILSSIPFDWYARRFVEANVTKSLMSTFPVPVRVATIISVGTLWNSQVNWPPWMTAMPTGLTLSASTMAPFDEDTKQEMVYELDAVVAHLYGLSREHVKVIFETFHNSWDYQERLDHVLDYYDDWAEQIDPRGGCRNGGRRR